MHYQGKQVYMGIDVHKKSYSITAICDGLVVKQDTLPASPQGLVDYCNKFFKEAQVYSAYEAGFSGFSLHRLLASNDIFNLVVHPAGIETMVRNRVKNDRRDSMKIAVQLSTGRLQGIQVPSVERERYRSLSRLRETLVRHRKRVGNQLKSFLYFHGLISEESSRVICLKWIEEIMAQDLPYELSISAQVLGNTWKEIRGQISIVDKKLEEQSVEDSELEKIYHSVPGIGPVSARILANELGDMSQFSNQSKLFSYLGLTPSEYSSGEHTRRGSISRQGKSILRKTLVQSAWIAIRLDPSLDSFFVRISQRSGKKRAIVAVARKLAGCIRACLRENRAYKVQS